MDTVVLRARRGLEAASKTTQLITPTIRSVSASLFRELDDHSIGAVFSMCEELLEEKDQRLSLIAYDWAFRVQKQYTADCFDVFESWLLNYVRDWGDCDDFCTHAFGKLLSEHNELFDRILPWTQNPNFGVRRASAVVLIYPIRHSLYEGASPYLIADTLMNDPHYLVLKGYGWMLKVLSEREPEKVFRYLLENREKMPRIAFRYAMEKMDAAMKKSLMVER